MIWGGAGGLLRRTQLGASSTYFSYRARFQSPRVLALFVARASSVVIDGEVRVACLRTSDDDDAR